MWFLWPSLFKPALKKNADNRIGEGKPETSGRSGIAAGREPRFFLYRKRAAQRLIDKREKPKSAKKGPPELRRCGKSGETSDIVICETREATREKRTGSDDAGA